MTSYTYSPEKKELTINGDNFSHTFSSVSNITAEASDDNGLVSPYTRISCESDETPLNLRIWENLPVVFLENNTEKPLFKLRGEHWTIRCIKLNAFTDECDTLLTESEFHLINKSLLPQKGDIFYFENEADGDARILISETADYMTGVLTISNGEVSIENGGNPVTFGFCKAGECESLCKSYYRHATSNKDLVMMSNIWGDRGGPARACRDFVMKEIDAASEIGIDAVQIDDGWQVGEVMSLHIYDIRGSKRRFHDDFWEVSKEKFPNGIKEVTDYATSKGIKMGLWFAPRTYNDFEKLEDDKLILKKAYEEWGIKYFKLDMYWISNESEQEKFLDLLQYMYSFGDDISVEMDITRDERLNYFCGKEYGTLFVENRYTEWANYFPHRTLRNLWMISRHLPLRRFQFELPNPDRNTDRFEADDIFVAKNYDMDYLFATVMLSNPLFWMELQFLSEERRSELSRILGVWKEHREMLSSADIVPIGEKPTGHSFPGFHITSGDEEYLLLFRELTKEGFKEIHTDISKKDVTILASNGDFDVSVRDGVIKLNASKPRSYAFIKLK